MHKIYPSGIAGATYIWGACAPGGFRCPASGGTWKPGADLNHEAGKDMGVGLMIWNVWESGFPPSPLARERNPPELRPMPPIVE